MVEILTITTSDMQQISPVYKNNLTDIPTKLWTRFKNTKTVIIIKLMFLTFTENTVRVFCKIGNGRKNNYVEDNYYFLSQQ